MTDRLTTDPLGWALPPASGPAHHPGPAAGSTAAALVLGLLLLLVVCAACGDPWTVLLAAVAVPVVVRGACGRP